MNVYFKKDYPKYLVLEIGADRKNDIKDICEYIKPDIAVVTAFAKYPVHIENFKDKDELIREKRYLIEAIKDNGKLIYNCECPDTIKMIQDAKNEGTLSPNIDIYSYGINVGDVFVNNIINSIEDKNVSCKVIINDDENKREEDIVLDSVFGEAAILSSLPGIMITKLLNLKIKNTIQSLRVMRRAPGRMRLLDGQNNITIIDDTYNSSPIAVENGLKTLREIKVANPYINIITILGDMMELGDMSMQAHNDIGKAVSKSYIDKLIVVGIRSKEVKSSAIENGLTEKNIYEYTDSTEASNNIMNILSEMFNKRDIIIYIKGSQSMRMERIVRTLLDNSLDPNEYLVRQEKE
ncbi:MAG: Mur ligase family protein [Candidatus Pacebacteria bacterium]|nr:Mur ligase family protein [Candidatus Paceibacterota bacterium]